MYLALQTERCIPTDDLARESALESERNLALRPELEQLRSETMAAFAEARELKARWRDIERSQASAYQVWLLVHGDEGSLMTA